MTFQEVTEQWSQRPHLLALLQPEITSRELILDPDLFLERFVEGNVTEDDVFLGHDPVRQQRVLAQLRVLVAQEEAEEAAAAAAGQPQLQ